MNSAQKSGEIVKEIDPADVMMGRGKRSTDHPGNVRFRALVLAASDEYNRSHTGKRLNMVERLIAEIHGSGGRFVQSVTVANGKGETSAAWEVVSAEKVLAKVKQALRDQTTRRRKSAVRSQKAKESTDRREAHAVAPSQAAPNVLHPQVGLETMLQRQQQQRFLASMQSARHHNFNPPLHTSLEQQLRSMMSEPSLPQGPPTFQRLPSSWPLLPPNNCFVHNIPTVALPQLQQVQRQRSLQQLPQQQQSTLQLHQMRQHLFHQLQQRNGTPQSSHVAASGGATWSLPDERSTMELPDTTSRTAGPPTGRLNSSLLDTNTNQRNSDEESKSTVQLKVGEEVDDDA